jgi:outer membrane biosynthesis protein TonB
MDFNLEKVISDYKREALNMANKGQSTVDEPENESVMEKKQSPVNTPESKPKSAPEPESKPKSVPEPEPKPKSAPEPEPKPKSAPEPEPVENDDSFEDFIIEENLGETAQDVPEKEVPENEEKAGTPPSFDDYISRRARSWERGTSMTPGCAKTDPTNPCSGTRM